MTPLGVRARKTVHKVFPADAANAGRLAREWLGRPFRDHVIVTRIATGREHARDWPIEMRGAPPILTEPGQSFLVAIGHFSREPVAAIYLSKIIPKRLAAIVASLDKKSLSPRALRLRFQFGEMVRAIVALREGDVEMIEVGDRGVIVRTLKFLREPGSVVVISPDVPWSKGHGSGVQLPFAAFASQTFAIGSARLARVSQCPILPCVPFLDDHGRVVLEWGEPIPAPAKDDEAGDERVTREVLAFLERGIGRRPGQYVLVFGQDRRWNAATEAWENGAVHVQNARKAEATASETAVS